MEKVTEKKTKKLAIRLVQKAGEAGLVEWVDGADWKRAYIPLDEVAVKVDETVLDAGIPYGLEWNKIKPKQLDPLDLQNQLRKAGIWTAEDLAHNPQAASLALLEFAGANLTAIIEFSYKKEA